MSPLTDTQRLQYAKSQSRPSPVSYADLRDLILDVAWWEDAHRSVLTDADRDWIAQFDGPALTAARAFLQSGDVTEARWAGIKATL